MNDIPRKTIRDIISHYGAGVITERGRVEGLLMDLCGQYGKEVWVLVTAIRGRVPNDLLAVPVGTLSENILVRLSSRLHNDLVLTEGAALGCGELGDRLGSDD